MPRKRSDFKSVKAEWYKKLKQSGFIDIEANESKLKRYDSEYFHTEVLPIEFSTTQEYFLKATAFLNSYKFPVPYHRRVWELHCDGKTEQQIAVVVGFSQQRVSDVIRGLAKVMFGK